MTKKNFDIIGMSCAVCVSHVQKAVEKLQGVNAVNVNLLTNSMSVEFDENKVTAHVIEKAVADAGYEAHLKDSEKKKP